MSMPKPESFREEDPRLFFEYQSVWFRRGGDEGTTWSQESSLGSFGEDRAGSYRIGWYSNPMERYEFAYLGTLMWDRSAEVSGPVNSTTVAEIGNPAWKNSLDGSSMHTQHQTADLQSFELNKRWITDDLGNYFVGFHAIDYREAYTLRANRQNGVATLGIDTANVLAGAQFGMEMWRPVSQRLAFGSQGLLGVYGNFADGGWHVEDSALGTLGRTDRRFQIAGTFGLDLKARYLVGSRFSVFGAYRWWTMAGMASVDDQTPGPLGPNGGFVMSTDGAFLLQGVICGVDFVF